jgi:hypothetical protein
VSLSDLLRQHSAPGHIEYLSVDTEGSELGILQGCDFSTYQFDIITVEHNFTANREPIAALLRKHGYTRVFSEFSQWDDWYVHSCMLSRFQGLHQRG